VEQMAAQVFDPDVLPQIRFFPTLPPDHHRAVIQELRRVEKQMGQNTRLRQELRNLLYNVALQQRLEEALDSQTVHFIYERYTLFHAAGIAVARRLGVPHLLEVNAPLAEEQKRMRGLELEELAVASENWIWQNTDRLLVVSRQLAALAEQRGVAPEKITVVPNGINPDRFNEAATGQLVREHWRLVDTRVIGFVGSLKNWHGTRTLVEAFAGLTGEFPEARLLIVGDGPEKTVLQDLVRSLQLKEKVIFTGKIPHPQIPEFIAAMDIAVAPYVPQENFYFSPIKIFEYMAAGKAVVAGRIGQVEEILSHKKTGWLYPPGDVAALAEALRQLLKNPKFVQSLGQRARRQVLENYTWEGNARRVLAEVQKLQEAQSMHREG
ncbi:MAG: glycosyltransferase family 1 protein, partial [Calditrichaeota bacterium]